MTDTRDRDPAIRWLGDEIAFRQESRSLASQEFTQENNLSVKRRLRSTIARLSRQIEILKAAREIIVEHPTV